MKKRSSTEPAEPVGAAPAMNSTADSAKRGANRRNERVAIKTSDLDAETLELIRVAEPGPRSIEAEARFQRTQEDESR